MIPWGAFEEKYAHRFSKKKGRGAKPARMALGAMLVKEKLQLSDEETVEIVRENPYIQYLLGIEGFRSEKPFDKSTMTWFRKRVTPEMIADLNEFIISYGDDDKDSNDKDSNDGDDDEDDGRSTMILDATCAPADIRYPLDVSIVSEAREKSEALIDIIHAAKGKKDAKPRTYRRIAEKLYNRFCRKRKPSAAVVRKARRKQLGFLGRNLDSIEKMGLQYLNEKQLDLYDVLMTVFDQQMYMHETKTKKVPDRIVSIHQPHVRPIVRGKRNAPVEFGAKVAISAVGGFVRVEALSWDPFNETTTFIDSVEAFKKREGRYPKRVLADKIYRTRENLAYCRERSIHMNGPKLGRPPADDELYRQQLRQERDEAGERNTIEGIFGTGKRTYGLGRVMARLKDASEVQIYVTFLVMNLRKKLSKLDAVFLSLLCRRFLGWKKRVLFHLRNSNWAAGTPIWVAT
jgi:hypothetical protein